MHDYRAVGEGMRWVYEPRYKCKLTGDIVPVDGFCHRAEYRKENYENVQKKNYKDEKK